MEHTDNQIILRGYLKTQPEFSHENHRQRFFRFYMEVPRLSGTMDCLPVIVQEQTIQSFDFCEGAMVTVTGTVRSHNMVSNGKRHLLVFVFAASLFAETGSPINEVTLRGILCKEPIFRRTPLGREICDMMLAVPRNFHRADYIPCILWGKTAQDGSALHTRDTIEIYGRLQSRIYTKVTETGQEERTAYEVSALSAQVPDIFP